MRICDEQRKDAHTAVCILPTILRLAISSVAPPVAAPLEDIVEEYTVDFKTETVPCAAFAAFFTVSKSPCSDWSFLFCSLSVCLSFSSSCSAFSRFRSACLICASMRTKSGRYGMKSELPPHPRGPLANAPEPQVPSPRS